MIVKNRIFEIAKIIMIPLILFVSLELAYILLWITEYNGIFGISIFYLCIGIVLSSIYSYFLLGKSLFFYTGIALPKMKWVICSMILPMSVSLFYLVFIDGNLIRHYLSPSDRIDILRHYLILAGIVGPIIEEIIFRGILLGHLTEKMTQRKAVILSSFLFGLCHLWDIDISNSLDVVTRMIGIFIIGVAFSLITIESGSIWSSVIFHSMYNILSGDSRVLHISNESIRDVNGFLEYTVTRHNRWLMGVENADMLEAGIPTIIAFTIVCIIAYQQIRNRVTFNSAENLKYQVRATLLIGSVLILTIGIRLRTADIPEELYALEGRYPETVYFVEDFSREQLRFHSLDISSDLQKREIPLFLQWDRRWGYRSYGGKYLAVTGCAPTCLSMVTSYLKDDPKWNPYQVALYSEQWDYYIEDIGTSWDLMYQGAEQLGLNVEIGAFL